VRELCPEKAWRALPKANVFCTKRAWDEVTEKSRMAGIENRYFSVLANPGSFKDRDHEAISAYYVLWYFRFLAAAADRKPLKLNIEGPERELNQDTRERLESHGVMFINPDSTINSR